MNVNSIIKELKGILKAVPANKVDEASGIIAHEMSRLDYLQRFVDYSGRVQDDIPDVEEKNEEGAYDKDRFYAEISGKLSELLPNLGCLPDGRVNFKKLLNCFHETGFFRGLLQKSEQLLGFKRRAGQATSVAASMENVFRQNTKEDNPEASQEGSESPTPSSSS